MLSWPKLLSHFRFRTAILISNWEGERMIWHRLNMNEPPCQQQVFAYLPLRNYGFRFVVQADFVVPSSREDVDRDNTWNEWLRSEIPSLFIEAFDRLKHASSPDEFMPIGRMFQFIPAEGEVTGFFQSVGRSILCMPRTKADFEIF